MDVGYYMVVGIILPSIYMEECGLICISLGVKHRIGRLQIHEIGVKVKGLLVSASRDEETKVSSFMNRRWPLIESSEISLPWFLMWIIYLTRLSICFLGDLADGRGRLQFLTVDEGDRKPIGIGDRDPSATARAIECLHTGRLWV